LQGDDEEKDSGVFVLIIRLQGDDEEDSDDDQNSSAAVDDQMPASATASEATQNVYSLAKDVEETPSSNESISFTPSSVSAGIPSHRILFQVRPPSPGLPGVCFCWPGCLKACSENLNGCYGVEILYLPRCNQIKSNNFISAEFKISIIISRVI